MNGIIRSGFTFVVAAVAAGWLAAPPAQAQQFVSSPVTLTGGTATGLDAGTTLGTGLTSTTINAGGQTAFSSDLTGTGVDATNNVGLFSQNTAGDLGLTARTGDQAAGLDDGVTFGAFGDPAFNAGGQTAFRADLAGTGVDTTNNVGLFAQDASGNLGVVARAGDQATGLDTGVNFSTLDNPSFNAAGQTAFRSELTGTGVDATNNVGLFSNTTGTLAPIARTGTQANGLNTGVNFAGLSNPALNANGRAAFRADLAGTGVDTTNDAAIFAQDAAGTPTMIARSGAQAADLDVGVNFADFNNPTINAANRAAFRADLTGTGIDDTNDLGIFAQDAAGDLGAVAQTGDQAAGADAGVNFAGFDNPIFNDADEVAFRADLDGTGIDDTNDSGIFSDASGDLDLVAQAGDQAVGAEAGVNFAAFNSLAFNDAGEAAFLADLTGSGVDDANDVGLFAQRGDMLELIAREGEELEVAPGEFRTISALSFVGDLENEGGQASGFNEAGQLTFGAQFTDGTSGVFTSQVIPEPATLALLGLGGLVMIRRRRTA